MIPVNPYLLGVAASVFGKLAFKEVKVSEETGKFILNKIESAENLARNIENVEIEKPATYISPAIKFVKKYIRDVSRKPYQVDKNDRPMPELSLLLESDRDGYFFFVDSQGKKKKSESKEASSIVRKNIGDELPWEKNQFIVFKNSHPSYSVIFPLLDILAHKDEFTSVCAYEKWASMKGKPDKSPKDIKLYDVFHDFLKAPDGELIYLYSSIADRENPDKFVFGVTRLLPPGVDSLAGYGKYLLGVIWKFYKNISFYDLSDFGETLNYNSDLSNFQIKEFKETSIQKELFEFLENHKTKECFSVIINGRPGFGKSLTCEYFANKFDKVVSLKLHEPAPMVDYVMSLLEPEVVIIDDLDRICDHTNASFFLSFFESIKEVASVKYVLLTSNNYSKIPVAVRRPGRISQYFDFKLPESKEERVEIVKQLISVMNCDFEMKLLNIEYLTDVFNAYGASGLKEYITRINSFGPEYKPSPSDKTFELAGKSEEELFEYYNKEAEQAKKEVSYYMEETLIGEIGEEF